MKRDRISPFFGSQSTSWLGVPLKLSGITVGVMAVQCYDMKDAFEKWRGSNEQIDDVCLFGVSVNFP